ncbi:hypothetical protein GGX14DRAFT_394994 [Mycena pura]|uniref:Uncharacterized protein n=1 Tax=Mycena pura TaxID=153505 RepID=A0AAD6VEX5_9AGAR|nr:hypothetical protein GGX14DRAFT_394994 [Mycena pura]
MEIRSEEVHREPENPRGSKRSDTYNAKRRKKLHEARRVDGASPQVVGSCCEYTSKENQCHKSEAKRGRREREAAQCHKSEANVDKSGGGAGWCVVLPATAEEGRRVAGWQRVSIVREDMSYFDLCSILSYTLLMSRCKLDPCHDFVRKAETPTRSLLAREASNFVPSFPRTRQIRDCTRQQNPSSGHGGQAVSHGIPPGFVNIFAATVIAIWNCPDCDTPIVRQPFPHVGEVDMIQAMYPCWPDKSVVTCSWAGLQFPIVRTACMGIRHGRRAYCLTVQPFAVWVPHQPVGLRPYPALCGHNSASSALQTAITSSLA